MKLWYVVNARIPTEKAHGYQISKMCEAFANLGIEVHLVVPKKNNFIKEDVFNFYNVKQNFSIHYLPVIGISPDYFILQTAVFLYKVKNFTKANIGKNDIIYTRDFAVSWFFRKYPRLMYEVHTASNLLKLWKGPWKNPLRVVVITNQLKKILISRGIAGEKIIVAPDAVDLSDFEKLPSRQEARHQLNLPLDKKLVGYVGKFHTLGNVTKGIGTLIESLRFLDDDVVAVMVGGMKKEIKHYKKMAEMLGVAQRVKFVPLQPRVKVPLYLKAMDVLVMPSPKLPFYQYYTSPLKLFEYMASGVAIVASDLPALREILNENNAKLVIPDNPKNLAEGVDKVLKDDNFAYRIICQAKKDVQDYTWEKRAKSILR